MGLDTERVPADLLEVKRDEDGQTFIEKMDVNKQLDFIEVLDKKTAQLEQYAGDTRLAGMMLAVTGIDAGAESEAVADAVVVLCEKLKSERAKLRALVSERLS